MKTAIFQCLKQVSGKRSKNVYHERILKELTLQCFCKIVQKVRFSL